MQRCVCGQSSRAPLCDGSHRSADWSCAERPDRVLARVWAAGHHAQALAERLAHARGGRALHRLEGSVYAAELIVLTDGTDLTGLQPALTRVDAKRTRLVVIGADAALLGSALPGATLVAVPDTSDPSLLWQRIAEALDAREGSPASALPARLFVSHAVADEPQLGTLARALRELRIDVFLCGDSIRSGSDWREHITGALRAADRFVLLLSRSSRESTWCAFESGMAVALGKPVQVLALDGAAPPSYLAHLHVDDVQRIRSLRPWLEPDELLIDAVLAPTR
jgi:hypothetical protein